jgi:hypothetical protein
MGPAMMPRVNESPNGQRKNAHHKCQTEVLLAEKELPNQKNEGSKKHQASPEPMRCTPGLRIFESPRGSDSNEVIGAHITEIVSKNDEKEQHAGHDDPAGRNRLA